MAQKIVQFNWRRHWKTKVEPFLKDEAVQAALDLGMKLLNPDWKRGDPPYLEGGVDGRVVTEGKLSWYQPVGRCHHIAPFSYAIGQINYPKLSWTILSSKMHSVAVGYDSDEKPRVVMDILSFNHFTAEESLEYAEPKTCEQFIAKCRQRALGLAPTDSDTIAGDPEEYDDFAI